MPIAQGRLLFAFWLSPNGYPLVTIHDVLVGALLGGMIAVTVWLGWRSRGPAGGGS